MVTDYQIFLIILTIIGFIITTALYVYFVYLPAARAEAQIDVIEQKGSDLIDLVNSQITTIEDNTTETIKSLCDSFFAIICQYNLNTSVLSQPCTAPSGRHCILGSQAYPQYCEQFKPFPVDPCSCVI
jgi:hypothetical protein